MKGKTWKVATERWYERYISLILLILGIGIYAGRFIWLAYTQIPSFDGSMNLQVAISLLTTGKYATLYNGGTVFDGRIQTGAPVLFLISAMFKLFGIGSFQALMINVFYIMLLVFFLAKISKKFDAWKEIILFFLAMTITTEHFSELSLGIYGEIPTLALFVGTVYFLMQAQERKKSGYWFLSGFFFGLAYLTKTVILIAVPALAIVFLSKWLLEKKMGIRNLLLWITGVILPVFLFEIYKFLQLGRNAYVSFWTSQFSNILRQAGVKSGYADTPDLLEKLFLHAQTFASYFYLDRWILWTVLILNFVWFVVKVVKRKKLEYTDILELVAYSYFGWWLLITPTEKAWGRRILIGMVILQWLTSTKIFLLINKIKLENWIKDAVKGCLAVIAVFIISTKLYRPDDTEKTACLELAKVVQEKVENENAIICGVEWWQAPTISFYSHIPFYDLNQLNMEEIDVPVYFVADIEWVGLSGMEPEDLPYEVEEVFKTQNREMKLFRVTNTVGAK